MPYANEHAARLREPDEFVRIVQLWGNDEGVRALGGPLKSNPDGPTVEQAIRFDSSRWTVAEARAWLKKHGCKPIRFEPATGGKKAVEHHLSQEEELPREVLCFAADFALGDNGEKAKSAPVRIVAATPGMAHHWFWGPFVRDMDGLLMHKERMPIDYLHDMKEIVGYFNRVMISEDEGLVLHGALVPFKDNDRATEIIEKAKAGVPYEASILSSFENLVIEDIPAGQTTEVNGQVFQGPLAVFRQWHLRGVAICPYGADMNTVSEFCAHGGAERAKRIIQEMKIMTQIPPAEAAASAAVEASKQDPAKAPESPGTVEAAKSQPAKDPAIKVEGKEAPGSVEAAVAPPVEAKAEPKAVEAAIPADRAECRKFVEAFGARGGEWFAAGLTFEQAQAEHAKVLSAENAELRHRLAQAGGGEASPLSAGRTPADEEADKTAEKFAALVEAFGGGAEGEARARRVMKLRAKKAQ
jgi:hypothetical protein